MITTSGRFIGIFIAIVLVAVGINFILVPAFTSYNLAAQNVTVGYVGATNANNASANTTQQVPSYSPSTVGLFGNPQDQLLAILLILGVSAGAAVISVFGAGAQPGPAAVVAFVVALALIIVNTLIAIIPQLLAIPLIGSPLVIVIVGFVLVVTFLVAAGVMSGSGTI